VYRTTLARYTPLEAFTLNDRQRALLDIKSLAQLQYEEYLRTGSGMDKYFSCKDQVQKILNLCPDVEIVRPGIPMLAMLKKLGDKYLELPFLQRAAIRDCCIQEDQRYDVKLVPPTAMEHDEQALDSVFCHVNKIVDQLKSWKRLALAKDTPTKIINSQIGLPLIWFVSDDQFVLGVIHFGKKEARAASYCVRRLHRVQAKRQQLTEFSKVAGADYGLNSIVPKSVDTSVFRKSGLRFSSTRLTLVLPWRLSRQRPCSTCLTTLNTQGRWPTFRSQLDRVSVCAIRPREVLVLNPILLHGQVVRISSRLSADIHLHRSIWAQKCLCQRSEVDHHAFQRSW
jgi:hypothetical protein